MENKCDDVVVIAAGHADRMDRFFALNHGYRSHIAHHVAFPDDTDPEVPHIADTMRGRPTYRLDAGGVAGDGRLRRRARRA